MTRLSVVLVLLILMMLPAGAQAPAITVLVNNVPVTFDQAPTVIGGSVMVPMRGVFERLGADVVWSPSDRTIRATHGDTTITLRLGDTTAHINGQAHLLSTPASSVGGRTMVPLRFVSEALGAQVRWSPASRTVAITTVAAAPPSPAAPAGPAIESVTTDAAPPLHAGQTITVRLQGDPGCQASFDVVGIFTHVPMSEQQPGQYVGSVQLPYNAQAPNPSIVASLQNPQGVSHQQAVLAQAPAPPPVAFAGVHPRENETVQNPRPRISVRLAGGAPLDPSSVRMTIDGHDVSAEVAVSQDEIAWTPNTDLPPGPATVMVSAQDSQGNRLRKEWNFTVEAAASPIRRVVVNTSQPLLAGQLLTVTMEALPAGQASFDIDEMRRHIPMSEVAPGRYVGTYQVQPGDVAINAEVVAHLVGPQGTPASRAAEQPVTLGQGSGISPVGVLPLMLQSPPAGATLPDNFLIAGQTAAHALVSINVQADQGSQYNEAQTVFTTQVTAGLNGYFEVPFQVQVPFHGGQFIVTVVAQVNDQNSAPVVVSVQRAR